MPAITSKVNPAAVINSAISRISDAQGVAADSWNAPVKVTPDKLAAGAAEALKGAELLKPLAGSMPRVGEARSEAIRGANDLTKAAAAWVEEIPVAAAMANVKTHADSAFKRFENALETLNNISSDLG